MQNYLHKVIGVWSFKMKPSRPFKVLQIKTRNFGAQAKNTPRRKSRLLAEGLAAK
jgi:hypothetical protein